MPPLHQRSSRLRLRRPMWPPLRRRGGPGARPKRSSSAPAGSALRNSQRGGEGRGRRGGQARHAPASERPGRGWTRTRRRPSCDGRRRWSGEGRFELRLENFKPLIVRDGKRRADSGIPTTKTSLPTLPTIYFTSQIRVPIMGPHISSPNPFR